MNRVSDLVILKTSLGRRAVFLSQLINALSPPLDRAADRLVSYTAVEALNTWASFARAYYLSCCVCQARRTSGTNVSLTGATITNTIDALFWACQVVRGAKKPPKSRREEPAWHDPSTLLRTFAVLKPSNLSQVQAAFSYQTDAFVFLPTIRNFFAHRNEETMHKVRDVARQLGINPHQRACDIMCSATTGRHQNVLADWLDDLRNVAVLLCV
jgi:hypothetical protein